MDICKVWFHYTKKLPTVSNHKKSKVTGLTKRKYPYGKCVAFLKAAFSPILNYYGIPNPSYSDLVLDIKVLWENPGHIFPDQTPNNSSNIS
jgi:hypothetical protein